MKKRANFCLRCPARRAKLDFAGLNPRPSTGPGTGRVIVGRYFQTLIVRDGLVQWFAGSVLQC
jgi:hypothetical protein